MKEPTGYWTFFCNPARWQIDTFLSGNKVTDIYQVSDWHKDYFSFGQLGAIRVSNDTRNKQQLNGKSRLQSGIYAVVKILGEARPRKEYHDSHWLDWKDKDQHKYVVDIEYVQNLLDHPVILDMLKANEHVTDIHLIKGVQSSTMPLDGTSFHALMELIGNPQQILSSLIPEQCSDIASVRTLEERYGNAAPVLKTVISKRIERGPLGAEAKKLTHYKCLLCEALGNSPYTFTKPNGEPYVEAHHVFPVSARERGLLSITNIITVCANHHRQLHYGNAHVILDDDRFIFTIDEVEIAILKLKIQ